VGDAVDNGAQPSARQGKGGAAAVASCVGPRERGKGGKSGPTERSKPKLEQSRPTRPPGRKGKKVEAIPFILFFYSFIFKTILKMNFESKLN
jgi:hypothetical protein